MPSSPNFLVVSRSEDSSDTKLTKSRKAISYTKSDEPHDEHEYNEVDVHIKISYKTLVFAFVTFDIIRHLIDRIAGLF